MATSQGQIEAAYDHLQKAEHYLDSGWHLLSIRHLKAAESCLRDAQKLARRAAPYLTGLRDLRQAIQLQRCRLGLGWTLVYMFLP